jgi:asparagine synthase (glutamine-hydrolysing)
MCGIVGMVRPRGGVAADAVTRMRDTMPHRGPDDVGTWISSDGRVGLGHRRLSILDLSPAGRQPMAGAGGELRIVFNGEIYNFRELRAELQSLGARFETGTDTEVLLAAYNVWGTDCVRRLNGMFALALYDERARRLLLARDRAGEKPLFYTLRGGGLAFASELKALLAGGLVDRVADLAALESYLCYGYVPGPQCILSGAHKLRPGELLEFDVATGTARTRRYWDLPQMDAPRPRSVDALADELESLLSDAVGRQLVADVPVGVLLSGGLDSSIIAALAARKAPGRVRTFTISFPGHGATDEGPFARAVASHIGSEHLELPADPASIDLVPALARQYDEPIADSSMVPTYLLSRLVREHVTVALGGDGGDELFGGYPHYNWLLQLEAWRRRFPRAVRAAAAVAGTALPPGTRGRNYMVGFAGELPDAVAHVNLYFDRHLRHALVPALASAGNVPPEEERAALCEPGMSVVRAATEVDFRTYLADDILVKVDRAGMLASLEVRAPYLDHRVIDFAFGRVPDSLRADGTDRKILLRRLAQRLLPPSFDARRKQGFSLPLTAWFRGRWGDFVRQTLLHEPSIFSPEVVRSLLAHQERGRTNTQRLFALTLFELWRREYCIEVPGAPVLERGAA